MCTPGETLDVAPEPVMGGSDDDVLWLFESAIVVGSPMLFRLGAALVEREGLSSEPDVLL